MKKLMISCVVLLLSGSGAWWAMRGSESQARADDSTHTTSLASGQDTFDADVGAEAAVIAELQSTDAVDQIVRQAWYLRLPNGPEEFMGNTDVTRSATGTLSVRRSLPLDGMVSGSVLTVVFNAYGAQGPARYTSSSTYSVP